MVICAGLKLGGNPVAQALLQLLACCTRAEHSVVLFITDGVRYHRPCLKGKGLRVCQDLEPRVAMYSMVTILNQVGPQMSYTAYIKPYWLQ